MAFKKRSRGENAIKKIRLLDGYGFNTSYNFLADSMNLSPIQFYLRTNFLIKSISALLPAMSPYRTDEQG